MCRTLRYFADIRLTNAQTGTGSAFLGHITSSLGNKGGNRGQVIVILFIIVMWN